MQNSKLGESDILYEVLVFCFPHFFRERKKKKKVGEISVRHHLHMFTTSFCLTKYREVFRNILRLYRFGQKYGVCVCVCVEGKKFSFFFISENVF